MAEEVVWELCALRPRASSADGPTPEAAPMVTLLLGYHAGRCGDAMQMLVEMCRTDRKCKVVINHAAEISLPQLRMLLAGYPTNIAAHEPQVLDISLRDDVFKKHVDMEHAVNFLWLFSQNLGDLKDHTLSVDAWKGLYQDIKETQIGLYQVVDPVLI